GLASAGKLGERTVSPEPRPEVSERLTFEVARGEVVEIRQDQAYDVPALQGQVGRLLRPPELAGHAQVDRDAVQGPAEGSGLVPALVRQRAGDRGVAVHPADRAVLALAVTGDDDLDHGATSIRG